MGDVLYNANATIINNLNSFSNIQNYYYDNLLYDFYSIQNIMKLEYRLEEKTWAL